MRIGFMWCVYVVCYVLRKGLVCDGATDAYPRAFRQALQAAGANSVVGAWQRTVISHQEAKSSLYISLVDHRVTVKDVLGRTSLVVDDR